MKIINITNPEYKNSNEKQAISNFITEIIPDKGLTKEIEIWGDKYKYQMITEPSCEEIDTKIKFEICCYVIRMNCNYNNLYKYFAGYMQEEILYNDEDFQTLIDTLKCIINNMNAYNPKDILFIADALDIKTFKIRSDKLKEWFEICVHLYSNLSKLFFKFDIKDEDNLRVELAKAAYLINKNTIQDMKLKIKNSKRKFLLGYNYFYEALINYYQYTVENNESSYEDFKYFLSKSSNMEYLPAKKIYTYYNFKY